MAPRPPSSTMPWWMKLVFLIFIGYVLYVGNFTSGTAPVATPIQSSETLSEAGPTIPKPDDAVSREANYSELRHFLDAGRWRRTLNPQASSMPEIKELQRGSGTMAGCGSEVSVRYRGTLSNGANFNASHDETEPQKFILGAAPIPAMNQGLIGMQVGGARQLTAAQSQVFAGAPTSLDSVLFRVEMLSQLPSSPPETLPFALMQVKPAASEALPQAQCGEAIAAELIWFDARGALTQREQRDWVLGDRSIAVGLDRAAHGMREGEVRFALLPPSWHPFGPHVASVLVIRQPDLP
jgi:FKBP-type peptidyl-prolyl cis-trans isomerase 2